MKINLTRIILSAGLLLAGGSVFATGETVLSPVKRQQALDRGKALVAAREIVPSAANPFYPTAFAEAVAAMGRASNATGTEGSGETNPRTAAGPRNDHELLRAIATSLKPSGYIVLGGQPSISFGQKRVKAGGVLTITFEGNQYTLEIVSIDRTNFTLRLNREEFTRTLK
ncbi:hypothetical protein [Opitutus sp. GAS368]|jgi:hypothetical protein|uniref:hypothetical protein n=1 Tax=Opitutus sp. GAS368 TaxID=1882749 RepID=UPI00087DEAAD|nr:hypothetical protein [Opitutus sp. GAS368]SDS11609.1 hypothetical protein SAMN05444173_1934 [Opitutus sp. GAS368]